MDFDDTDRINQILNELEDIPRDDEILSDDEETEDHDSYIVDQLITDTVFGNFETYNINNLTIQCKNGLIIDNFIEPSVSVYHTNEIQNNMYVDSVENEYDEESLASRIHKDSIKWYNYFRHVDRNDFFSEPVGPTESVIDNLVDPFSSFQQIFPNEIIDNLVYQTNLYVMQKVGDNNKPVSFEEIKKFLGISILMGIKKSPSFRDYWSSTEEMRDPYIS